jgi:hypothetical protein
MDQTKQRVSHVLRAKNDEICQRMLAAMKSDPELAALPLSDEERLDHTRSSLKELAKVLDSTNLLHQQFDPPHQKPDLPAAAETGKVRQEQKYPIALLAVNARLLQGVIYEVIHENLLSVDLSNLMLDLKLLNEALSLQTEEVFRSYLKDKKR